LPPQPSCWPPRHRPWPSPQGFPRWAWHRPGQTHRPDRPKKTGEQQTRKVVVLTSSPRSSSKSLALLGVIGVRSDPLLLALELWLSWLNCSSSSSSSSSSAALEVCNKKTDNVKSGNQNNVPEGTTVDVLPQLQPKIKKAPQNARNFPPATPISSKSPPRPSEQACAVFLDVRKLPRQRASGGGGGGCALRARARGGGARAQRPPRRWAWSPRRSRRQSRRPQRAQRPWWWLGSTWLR